jgi:D-alanyl-D-alanine carboxypeptidase (penicillin-binding protein 5/6)
VPPDFAVAAESAVVIDAATGSIVYEKNADTPVPPASLTKIAVMYVVLQEIAEGRYHPDDVVPLPPESWAVNAPERSSLMFLGPGQVVTLGELLTGLAVASGNDAAVALALFSSGTVEAYCQKMNSEMEKLGLRQTRFVDTSGYSARNTTTAREYAALARVYVERFPQALAEYHSRRAIVYPREKGIAQNSTNKALFLIPGCDGLKTGYIPEAGYNLALTVRRGDTRLIAVTLGGPGTATAVGNVYRFGDATAITEWFFATFATRPADTIAPIAVRVKKGVRRSVNLVPAYTAPLTVPAVNPGELPEDAAKRVTLRIEAPAVLEAPIRAADAVGYVQFVLDDVILAAVPLVTDRTVRETRNPLRRLQDWLF